MDCHYETHNAVLAEMRELEAGAEAAQICGEIGEMVERETVTNCNAVNAAKMREALEDAEKTLSDSSRSLYGIPPHLHELLTRIRAALSAPPRNCDRFTSVEEAWDSYDEWVDSYRAKGEIEPLNEFGWLFAEAKGECDGSK